ncbi:hypothetical protein GGC65_004343 [Sphingopyxis sp. OAS728]|uniref:VOC family protein n=1 Tax=Sphingopyxis sp. OAS728 TaxID=2663823 RepID=UPI00178A2DB6|nr:VOC family protein [Sphingopyxis sp. OAS728]MBE1529887.1 hypothetical protein [Sphingopyxis sp. OAS728]
MQQQISVVTLGIANIAKSRRFYAEGFGWSPVFENDEIIFYQMNGLMLGTWLKRSLEDDMRLTAAEGGAAFALAHNVASPDEVRAAMAQLVANGGRVLREADAPEHGGYRGYGADPDGHAWEIAWNPAWSIDSEGRVTFGE